MTKSKTSDDANWEQVGCDAAANLGQAISNLVEAGAVQVLEKLLQRLAASTSQGIETFEGILRQAKDTQTRLEARVSSDITRSARTAKCEVRCNPPFYTIGCVTIHHGKSGKWDLTVLDKVVVESTTVASGTSLAQLATAQISQIENSLSNVERFREILLEICKVLPKSLLQELPVNLLLLLCSQGRHLRKALTSGPHGPESNCVSRAQLGYLLSHLVKQPSSGKKQKRLELKFVGATQHDTAANHSYIAVPESDDPKKMTEPRMVRAVKLDV